MDDTPSGWPVTWGRRRNRRRALRVRSLLLFRQPRPFLVVCMVLSLTDRGAILAGRLPAIAPSRCTLLIGGDPHVRRCGRIASRRGVRIAMRFERRA